ncbi:MAG: hypothetical protein H7Y09_11555 [Chitinophagaceae bacterium]|nr:hypothetical protein [Anaerolineae bacterium]
MSTLEQELIAKITSLDAEKQRKVLEFVASIEAPEEKIYTLEELMQMPYEERSQRVAEALRRSRNEDFEIFEANDFYEYDDE